MTRFNILMLLLVLSGFALADTESFITPGKPVDLESDLTAASEVLAEIEPGTKVTEIKRNQGIGYSKIALEDGKVGWVPSARLSEKAPTAGEQLLRSKDYQGLSSAQLAELLAKAKSEINELRLVNSTADQIKADRDGLQLLAKQLQIELAKEKEERLKVNHDRDIGLFISGALSILVGLIAGLILPRFRRRDGNKNMELRF